MLFIAVAFIMFLAGMEVDIFIPSYPEMQQQFSLSPAKVQLCLGLNFITYCIGSLYAGALGDRYGLRKVILCGLAIFVVGSVACCFAMPMVVPVNIIYPLSLNVIPETKSRAAALVNVARLVGSAIFIEFVSYIYDGRLMQPGLLIFGLSIVGLIFARSVSYWKNE